MRIIKKVILGKELTKREQNQMFLSPIAKNLVAEYIETHPLCATAEQKLFKLPHATKLILRYM